MKRFIVSLALLSCVLLVSPVGFAQSDSIQRGQAFLDLSSDAVIMDLSAHPDDEDGASLAYYRMKYGVTTYSILFTRGEGGQNEKGPELYEDLGVLRSDETRKAGAILGTNVVFLDFLDFGFSKTATETFQKWGGQMEVLRRLVYVIRKYKPDVLFTNHNTIDGHGHHQVVAITAIAAFDAAADPTMFPEQIQLPGVSLWQPRKLFFRAFGRMEGSSDVSNHILDVDSLRGVAYLDMASEALRQHRTQGMDRANLRSFGRGRSLYKLMRANSIYESDSTSFLSGIDLWRDPTIAPLRPMRNLISTITPDLPIDSLVRRAAEGEREIDGEYPQFRKDPLARRLLDHLKESLAHLVVASCGISMTVHMQDSILVPGGQSLCLATATSSRCKLSVDSWLPLEHPQGWTWRRDGKGSALVHSAGPDQMYGVGVGADALPTMPRPVYQYRSLFRSQEFIVGLRCSVNGQTFVLPTHVNCDIAPPQTLRLASNSIAYVQGSTRAPIPLHWEMHNWQPRAYKGTVSVADTAGWHSRPVVVNLAGGGVDTGTVLLAPPPNVKFGDYDVRVHTDSAWAALTIHVFEANVVPHTNVGIVESYDNTLEEATATLNVPSSQIDDSTLVSGNLSQYSTIIVDIRAYLVRSGLKTSNGRLLDFVRNGGTLVVMYQRDQEWKPEYAPYPFTISRRRVTREEAPITILAKDDPLLSTPNRIGADWWDWKQERGLYFPADVPQEYTRLVSCSDPDEEPLTTGYLRTSYGKGEYVYTSYVWYRQMKEGNRSAFRCFANMISLRGKGSRP